MIHIGAARFPEEQDTVRGLFREYADGLGIDLSFQDFEAELAHLPGKFAPPSGEVLLARSNTGVVGCIAMRLSEGHICEMKRLYVRPAGRGQQVGKQLALALCQSARSAGYTAMRLDTLSSMSSAIKLYEEMGFERIPAYIYNPLPNVIYMQMSLE